MPYNPCWEYILHPQRCAKKKNHAITANELVTEAIPNCMHGKAKVGLFRATSVGPVLLPGGDRGAQGDLHYALQQEPQESLCNRVWGAG